MHEPGSIRGKYRKSTIGNTVAVLLLAVTVFGSSWGCSQGDNEATPRGQTVLIGTYTRGWPCRTAVPMDCTGQGIYSAQFNMKTGALSAPALAATSDNPSYLAVSANGRYVYAVNEIDDWGGVGSGVGAVSAFAVEDDTLRTLNRCPRWARNQLTSR